MSALTHDIRLEAGAGFSMSLTQYDANDVILPFTAGTVAKFQARREPRATGDPIVESLPVVDHAGGKLTLTLTAADTRAFDVADLSRAFYAIELSVTGQEDVRFAQGAITITSEVVR